MKLTGSWQAHAVMYHSFFDTADKSWTGLLAEHKLQGGLDLFKPVTILDGFLPRLHAALVVLAILLVIRLLEAILF